MQEDLDGRRGLGWGIFFFKRCFSGTFWPQIKPLRSTTFWPNLDISFLTWIWATHVMSERMGQVLHDCVEVLSDAKEKLGIEAIYIGVSTRVKLPFHRIESLK
jgi:hypothetical protein